MAIVALAAVGALVGVLAKTVGPACPCTTWLFEMICRTGATEGEGEGAGVTIAPVCCKAACCVASLAIRMFWGSCCVAIHPPMLKADRTKNTPDTIANRLALMPSVSLTTEKIVFLCSLRERMVRSMNKTVSPLNSAAEINSVNDRYGIIQMMSDE